MPQQILTHPKSLPIAQVLWGWKREEKEGGGGGGGGGERKNCGRLAFRPTFFSSFFFKHEKNINDRHFRSSRLIPFETSSLFSLTHFQCSMILCITPLLFGLVFCFPSFFCTKLFLFRGRKVGSFARFCQLFTPKIYNLFSQTFNTRLFNWLKDQLPLITHLSHATCDTCTPFLSSLDAKANCHFMIYHLKYEAIWLVILKSGNYWLFSLTEVKIYKLSQTSI